jgi:hypothetical protein
MTQPGELDRRDAVISSVRSVAPQLLAREPDQGSSGPQTVRNRSKNSLFLPVLTIIDQRSQICVSAGQRLFSINFNAVH